MNKRQVFQLTSALIIFWGTVIFSLVYFWPDIKEWIVTGLTKAIPRAPDSSERAGMGKFEILGSPEPDEEERIAITATKEDIKKGRDIYLENCVWCHGLEGKGDGVAAPWLVVKPTNFRSGNYKIRSTLPQMPPTDGDLLLTVRYGMPGSSMPSYEGILSEEEQRHVVAYIKEGFLARGASIESKEDLVNINYGTRIPPSEESIARGSLLYKETGCEECHGEHGRGDGNVTLKNVHGSTVFPTDLTKAWSFKGNRRDPYNPKHVFRTLSTGMDGTSMPSYIDDLTIDERWDLSNHVVSLSPQLQIDRRFRKPVVSHLIPSSYHRELPRQPDDPQWKIARTAYIPLTNNIYSVPRHFIPSVDNIVVRSVYNKKQVVFLIEWNDRTQSLKTDNRIPFYDAKSIRVIDEGERFSPNRMVFNDAVALQFPQKWEEYIPKQPKIDYRAYREEIMKGGGGPLSDKVGAAQYELPHFLFGDEKKGVDIWKWESDGEVHSFTGKGPQALMKHEPSKSRVIHTNAIYKSGHWRVMMSRSLTTQNPEQEVQFKRGRNIPMTFFVWDGDAGETGTKMSFSAYVPIVLMPTKEGQLVQLRSIFPENPKVIEVRGESFNIMKGHVKYRELEKESRRKMLLNDYKEGASVYFGKGACFFCHGANGDGNGVYAQGLRPFPYSFMDRGNGLQFGGSYAFWRVAKGGADLPKFGHPWASTMPAGEQFLTVKEIKEVVRYLQWKTGYMP